MVLCLLLACGRDEGADEERTMQEGGPSAEAAADEWPCEKQGYPCTWEEVSDQVTQRSFALADQVLERFEPGGASEVLAWLAAQPRVVDSGEEDPTIVWFRLEGGRPFFVQGPLPPSLLGPPLTPASSSSPGPSPEVHLASTGSLLEHGWEGLSALLAEVRPAGSGLVPGVTGRDRNTDRRVNQRDQRKALILESMWWEECYEAYASGDRREEAKKKRQIEDWCNKGRYRSVGDRIRRALEESPEYKGNIKVLRNQEVDFAAIGSWAEYDIVHIEGHGTRNSLCIGTEITYPGRGKLRGSAAKRRGIDPTLFRAGQLGPKKSVWCVNNRFFRSLYPRGLRRTLIFVNACSTLGHPKRAAPPMARQLLGPGSMYVGWGAVTTQWDKWPPIFYENLVEGWAGRTALKWAIPPGQEAILAEGTVTAEDMMLVDPSLSRAEWEEKLAKNRQERIERGEVLGIRGSDLRIFEVVKLLYPPMLTGASREPIEDGDPLEPLVVGELGDEVDDQLRVSVEVEPLLPEEVEKTRLRLELDGIPIGEEETLTARHPSGPTRRVRPDNVGLDDFVYERAYRHDFEDVPVGKDLEPEREYELEVIVKLPEGDESRYAAKLKGEGCPVVVQGDFEGQLGGGHAQTFRRNRKTQAKIFLGGAGRPANFHLEQREGGRDGWGFSLNAWLDQPIVAGARIRVEEDRFPPPPEAVEAAIRGGAIWPKVSGTYRPGGGADAWQFPKGAVNVTIRQVRWVANSERSLRQGMACGEVEANLEGLVPNVYPFQFVPHLFKATFWAEIRRETSPPGATPGFPDPGDLP